MNFDKLRRYAKHSLLDCSWEKDGVEILTDDKLSFKLYEKEKLKYLISKSTPTVEIRRKLWLIACGAKKEKLNNPNYYEKLQKLSLNIRSLNEHQINIDLERTFPEEKEFQTREYLQKLKNVLICYSLRNSSVGYCQGFNFIVARLLQVFDSEEDVFWMFTQILEELLPLNYYSELVGIITDSSILVRFVEKYLPDLFKFLKLNDFELNLNTFIHKWLVSLFVQSFDKDFSFLILDFFFLEGNLVLFKAALAALRILKKELMKSPFFEDIYDVMNARTNQISKIYNSKDDLIFYLSFRHFEFDYDFLNQHRHNLMPPIIENIIKENDVKLKLKQKNMIQSKDQGPCDHNRHFCLAYIQDDFQHRIISFLAFRVKNYPPVIIDNFYKNTRPLCDNINQEDITIERHIHKCKVERDEFLYDISYLKVQEHKNSQSSQKSQGSPSFKFTNMEMDEIKKIKDIEDEDTDEDQEYLRLLNNIRLDRNYTKATSFLNKTFVPKPFDV